MSGLVEFVTLRGEYVSLLLVAVALMLARRPVATLLRVPASEVGDLFWNAGVAFVVVGRLGYLATESPDSLLDPLVLIRIQGGLHPFLGVLAGVAIVAWHTRRERGLSTTRVALLAALAAGLVVATVTYDAACVVRDACYGAAAPSPLGFAMSGLSDTRLATPLIEAALLLLAAGALLSSRLPGPALLSALGGCAALLRSALTPASVRGAEAVGLETAAFVLLGVTALALAWWQDRTARQQAPTTVPNSG